MSIKFFLLCFLLFTKPAWAVKAIENEIKPNTGESYIEIFRLDQAPPRNRVINVFDNASLSGKPRFQITESYLLVGSNKYIFKEMFIQPCNKSVRLNGGDYVVICNGYKTTPFDFLRVYSTLASIAISDVKDGVATILDKGKKYYFLMNPEELKGVSWKFFDNKTSILSILKEDESFSKFKKKLHDCIIKKSQRCLEELSKTDYVSTKKIESLAKRRLLLDSKATCEEFGNLKIEEIATDTLNQFKDINFLWSKLERVLQIDDKNVRLKLNYINPKNNYIFISSIPIDPKENCGNSTDIAIELIKDAEGWSVIDISFYSFDGD